MYYILGNNQSNMIKIKKEIELTATILHFRILFRKSFLTKATKDPQKDDHVFINNYRGLKLINIIYLSMFVVLDIMI